MARARYASLLDDPAFVSALEAVEVSGPPAVERPTSQWFVESEPAPAPATRVVESGRPIGQIVLGLAGFLVMMGIGGAAAAYVFADRVALILAR